MSTSLLCRQTKEWGVEMIDRLILSAVLGTVGWNGLFPDPPPPPTPMTLKQKAKERSMSRMCDRKKQTVQSKELCKQWKEKQNG